jgi:hypothetical protein
LDEEAEDEAVCCPRSAVFVFAFDEGEEEEEEEDVLPLSLSLSLPCSGPMSFDGVPEPRPVPSSAALLVLLLAAAAAAWQVMAFARTTAVRLNSEAMKASMDSAHFRAKLSSRPCAEGLAAAPAGDFNRSDDGSEIRIRSCKIYGKKADIVKIEVK